MQDDRSAGRPAHVRQKPGSPPEVDSLTIGELATWLRISRTSAWGLLFERREIPYLRISDRTVRIPKEGVQAFIDRSRSDVEDR